MRKRNKSLFFRILLLVYIFLLLGTLAGGLAPYLDVSVLGYVQFLPVGLSFLIPLHLLAAWSYRGSRWLLLAALLGLGVSVWVGMKDYRPGSSDPIPEGDLTVVSFNVRTFEYQNARVDEAAELIRSLEPDVVCLQEFRNHPINEEEKADSYLARKLGMKYYRFVTLPVHIHGAVIFSRFPILKIDTLYVSAKEINSGILATLALPTGKVGVANLHLSSFHLEGEMKENPSWKEKVKNIPVRLTKVLKLQQQKVELVNERTRHYPYPLVIAADMNSAPHTRITTRLSNRFEDSFIKKGKGLGWTYPLLGPLGVRIDYLFSSSELEILNHRVVPSDVSDHYPIVATYRLVP